MFWNVLLGALVAFGVLCALWTLVGCLVLPRGRRGTMVFFCGPGERAKVETILRYYDWVYGLGAFAGRLLVVVDGMAPEELYPLTRRRSGWIEICRREDLPRRLEVERK